MNSGESFWTFLYLTRTSLRSDDVEEESAAEERRGRFAAPLWEAMARVTFRKNKSTDISYFLWAKVKPKPSSVASAKAFSAVADVDLKSDAWSLPTEKENSKLICCICARWLCTESALIDRR